ncbi:MAG: TetR/AcrR family transcriptional regulator [Oscillospiraceae bacterium]|nr:TetR/AcrR family transcriptional regulator [Oscillospiraceae bacterium]
MPRTNKDFDSRKEQLIQLALEQFIEKGYENTTITDLQKCFGLTKGGLYHYFRSKEEILDAVIEYGLMQETKGLIEELEQIPVEKKLIHFFFSTTTNAFTKNLFKYSKNNSSSIVTYRLREKTTKILVPILKNIMNQNIESGFYKSKYPDEMSEFSIILAQAITEAGMLSETDLDHKKKRIDAIVDMWSKCMKPPAEHIHELKMNLYKLISAEEN